MGDIDLDLGSTFTYFLASLRDYRNRHDASNG